MSRWLVTLALACFVAASAPQAEAQVFKPRNGAPAKGAKPADKPSDKKVAAADKADKPAAKKRPAAKKKKQKKADSDEDDTVTVEDDDVKISDD